MVSWTTSCSGKAVTIDRAKTNIVAEQRDDLAVFGQVKSDVERRAACKMNAFCPSVCPTVIDRLRHGKLDVVG